MSDQALATIGTGLGEPARWRRLLAHLASTPLSSWRRFPAKVLASIGAAIEMAEAGHTGEIRFVVEANMPWPYLWRNASLRTRALDLFGQLGVWDTEHNNGVLIYLGLADRGVEIIADRGISKYVPSDAWKEICDTLKTHYRAEDYEAGAIAAVRAVGALLQSHFPLAPGEIRRNELPDRPLAI
jgi:uncharacterized membrane protein